MDFRSDPPPEGGDKGGRIKPAVTAGQQRGAAMFDERAEPANKPRRLRRWLGPPVAFAFAASPLPSLASPLHLVEMCTADGAVTRWLVPSPADRAPDKPHKTGTCGHALCARDRDQPGRRVGPR